MAVPVEELSPWAADAEACVIGIALVRPEVVPDIASQIGEIDFTNPQLRAVWMAIARLDAEGEDIEPVSVREEMARQGTLALAGGHETLLRTMESPVTDETWPTWVRILLARTRRRELEGHIRSAMARVQQLDIDTEEVAESLRGALEARDDVDAEALVSGPVLLSDAVARVAAVSGGAEDEDRVMTGLFVIDNVLGGLHRGEMTILAATPSTGKSSLATTIAGNLAARNVLSLLFSMEVGSKEAFANILAGMTYVDAKKIAEGRLTEIELRSIREANVAPIHIDDSPVITASEIRLRTRAAIRKFGDFGAVLVDYIQIAKMEKGENRNLQVGEFSMALKRMARELRVPVIALSQLNRQAAGTEEMPKLHHLRDSGALEQDADGVIFLHRPGKNLPNPTPEQVSKTGVMIAKNRNGPTGGFELCFVPTCRKFENARDAR